MRLLLIGGAVVVAAIAVFATTVSRRTPAPTPTPPDPVRHYLVQVEQALATFDDVNVQASGSMRIRVAATGGAFEAVSFAIEALETSEGTTGPISVSLGEGSSTATRSGSTVSGSFPVRFWYPLLYDVAGEQTEGDVVTAKQAHTGTAAFEGRLQDDEWRATIKLEPDALDGGFNLPEGTVQVQAPALFETDAQFREGGGGGTRVWCIDVQNERSAFPDEELALGMRDMREIWRTHGAAFLTADQIAALNTRILGSAVGSTDVRDPARISTAKCYTIRLVKSLASGGGATADIARRTITIGANYTARCKQTSLGRMLAHMLGHVALRLETEASEAGDDNLMRECVPGELIDDEQRERWWSYVAEIAPKLTTTEQVEVTNTANRSLETLLDELAEAEPESTESPSPSPRPTSRATSRPASSPKATTSPSPSPARSPSPSPSGSPKPSPSPTASPAQTATPSPSPQSSP